MTQEQDLARFDPHATYDAAAADYLVASERFWAFLSDRTVERMALRLGDRVLDVASGPGWSALAAAERVGPRGSVIATDMSEQMLAITRSRASERGLANVTTEIQDMTALPYPDESFDAVISVLGIFFVDDMVSLVSNLYRLVRPGGQLAITVLGKGVFDPGFSVWTEEVRAVKPEALLAFPWQRTGDAAVFSQVLQDARVPAAIECVPTTLPVDPASDWWQIALGSGMRRTIIELGPDAAETVRQRTTARLTELNVTTVEVPAHFALATKG